ncbi:MAG: ABC transporter ATP-binding protein [Treponemataceae bacterium]
MIKLSTENIFYTYEDGTEAIRNINFDSTKGKIIGIIGANGCGKSTFFHLLMGLLKPQSGSILLNDKPIKYTKQALLEYRQKVNLVFQNPDVQIFFSEIYDDLAFPLRNLGFSEKTINEKVMSAIQAVNAEDFFKKPVHFLSAGQKKRVSIAGILAIAPEILLLDEPTAGLDPSSVKTIKLILQNLKQKTTIIISSHDMDFIYELADYIYIFAKGEKIAEGDKSVFNNIPIIEKADLVQPYALQFAER